MLTAPEIASKALPIDWIDLAKVSDKLLDQFDSYFKKK
jgi:iron(III) transport system substrate-binding protein